MKEYRVLAKADETYYVYAENEKDAIDAASQTDYARRDVEYEVTDVENERLLMKALASGEAKLVFKEVK